ncbi:MAG: 4Fe-4S binding protein, partial [Atopobiaceae bacterium]|nr:4Fe-4S binding protein [Atopobiaceae bacterium]
TKTLVDVVGERTELEPRVYESHPEKSVMMPANAVRRTLAANDREDALIAWAEETPLNRVEMRDTKIGIVCAGALFVHVREALPEASILKLGVTWPLPPAKLAAFAAVCDNVYVVEEACTYLETRVRALGISVATPPAGRLPRSGEVMPAHIRAAFGVDDPEHLPSAEGLPPRPPAFCAGCPHRLVYCELRRLKAIVTGDIGCYTLGAVAPYRSVDSVIDMGASLSMAHGMELAGVAERTGRPVVGVIGDSTFAHSGITSLLGTVYNGGKGTLCILDNRTTAMTGTQGNPVNGVTLAEQAARVNPLDVPAGKQLDLVKLCEAIGVDEVEQVDAQDLKAVRAALKSAVSHTDKLSVIIFKSPCRLIDRSRKPMPTIVDCKRCGTCVKIGCPALGKDETGHPVIDPTQCIGCGQCAQSCPFGCIKEA